MSSTLTEQVTRIWTDVLGARAAEAGATFIDLGGQSVSAVRLVTRIEEELGVWVDVGVLFDDPDLATFQEAVVSAAADSAAVPTADGV